MSAFSDSDVLAGRMNPGLPVTHLREALEIVRDRFGVVWLKDDILHPVRALWGREDFLATNELFWLGESITRMRRCDNGWVDRTLRKIKSMDRNERLGHMFEMLMLAAFADSGQTVAPAPMGMKDYDADVTLRSGLRLRLSLKNFAATSHQREFENRSDAIFDAILSIRQGWPWTGALMLADRYPKSNADWNLLRSQLTNTPFDNPGLYRLNNLWSCLISAPDTNSDSRYPSHSLMTVAPFHQNERLNFQTKIEAECLKFNAAAQIFPSNVLGLVVIRLDQAAPLATYAEWAREYVNLPDTKIAGVLFYQSTVAVQIKEDVTALHHTAAIAWRQGVPTPDMTISVPVGLTSVNPANNQLVMSDRSIDLDGHHWRQRHEVFKRSKGNLQSGMTAEAKLAPGRIEHIVIDMGGKTLVISPREQRPTEMRLFS